MSPFFIVGTGRCGTQMMRNILNCCTDVIVLPETHFIIALYDKFELTEIRPADFLSVIDEVYGSDGSKWVKNILRDGGKDYSEYKKKFCKFVERKPGPYNIKNLTEYFFEYVYGGRYLFGDKTPHYGTNIKIIRKIWPEAKIIHLVRDGVHCSQSMIRHLGFIKYINGAVKPRQMGRVIVSDKLFGGFSEEPPSSFAAAKFWEDNILTIIEEIQLANSVDILQIKYEDLIFEPIKTIRDVAYFLGLKFSILGWVKAICTPKIYPTNTFAAQVPDVVYDGCYDYIRETMQRLEYPYTVQRRGGINVPFHLFRYCFRYLAILLRRIKK